MEFVSEGCFNQAHGHPIPCGTWEIDLTRKALQEIGEEARRRGTKDFFITKEYYTELLNQDIHASQARFFKAAGEPHHVALAQYIYHEYVFSIFGWGCDNRPLSAQTAMLLVYGQIPCFPSWGKAIPPPATPATIFDPRQMGTSVAGISMTPVGPVTTIVVMDVSAMTRFDVAGRLWHGRRFPGEKPPACEIPRRIAAAWTGLDAHRMVWIHDALDLHAAAGQAHFRLNAPALPPG